MRSYEKLDALRERLSDATILDEVARLMYDMDLETAIDAIAEEHGIEFRGDAEDG